MTTPPFNCLSFDGIDDYLDCGKIDIYQQSYTIEAWFKTSAKNTQYIFSATLGGYQSIWMGMEDGKLTFSVFGDKLITNEAKNDGQWHHVAIVLIVDPPLNHMRQIYIDGIFVVSKDYSGFYAMGGLDTTIGRSLKETSSISFNGEIAEVRIWKKARTEQEIKTTKNQLLSGTETDLSAYWPFDSTDVHQGIVNDKAGTANATISGATWQLDNPLTSTQPNVSDPTPPLACNDTDNTMHGNEDSIFPESFNPVQPDPTPPQTTNPSVETDHLASLLTSLVEGDWRRQVVQDAKNAITNGALEMKDHTFQGFNLLKSVTDTLFDVVKIKDVQVELVPSAELEKVETAEADTGTPATVSTGKPATVGKGKTPRPKPPGKRFRLKTGGGVKISGKTDILGLVAAEVALEFSISDTKEKDALIKIKTSESEGSDISKILGGSLPKEVTDLLSVLSSTQLLYPAFAFSTSSVSDEEDPFDVGIDEGFNFYGKIKLSDFKSKKPSTSTNTSTNTTTKTKTAGGLEDMLGFMADVFKIEEITARLCIKKQALGGLDLTLDAVIEQDLEFSAGKNLKIVYRGAVISLGVGGSPPEPSIAVSSTVELTLSYIGAENLSLTGAIELEPESISPSFTLDAMDKPWHPFGFSGLSVKAMALEIGATYLEPWIDSFGVSAEELQIGKFTGSMGLKVDTNDYDKFVFSVQTPEITFWEWMSAFSPPVFVAYQALPDTVKNPLEKVVNCQIKDMELSVVPVATTIGEIKYDKEGITAKGEMHLWGWMAKMDARISTSEIDVSAEMNPLRLSLNEVELLVVEGAEAGKNAAFKLKLGLETNPEFLLSLSVTILGVQTKVNAKADKEGLRFILENNSSFGAFSLISLLHDTSFDGSGKFAFHLNEKIPLLILGTFQLNIDVSFDLTLQINSIFNLSLKGDLTWMNKSSKISFEIKEPLPKFEDVPKQLIAYLKKNASELFAAWFQKLEEWADAVKSGAIIFTGSAVQVAKEAFNLGESAAAEIIAAAKTIGETPAQIAEGFKDFYSWNATQVAAALKVANYTIDQVTNGLKTVYSLTETQVAQTLKSVSHSAEEVAKALQQTYGASVDGVTVALKGAGYAITEVSDALDYGLNATESSIKATLKTAGYAIHEIDKAIAPLNLVNGLSAVATSTIKSLTKWIPPLKKPWSIF